MTEKSKTKMVVVPCPRCGSFNTSPMDKKKRDWCCNNMNCLKPFRLSKHYALVFQDKEVIRVDKKHPFKKGLERNSPNE